MNITKLSIPGFTLILFLLFVSCSLVNAGEYAALDDLKDIKAVFDVRSKKIKTAALQIDLIHKTFLDYRIRAVDEKPEMAVVFGGAAVKLVSKYRDGYTDEEKMLLNLIADKLAAMAKDGIRLEICLFAADVFDVEPEMILPDIHHVNNGWISLIGYQAKGYSLVAVF